MKGLINKIIIISAGITTGLINGLFGGGGGMIVVPMLIFLAGYENKKAHATALAVILPVSVISGIIYLSFGNFSFPVGLPVTAGVIGGGILGALLLKRLSSKWITLIFAVAMFLAGVKLLFFK